MTVRIAVIIAMESERIHLDSLKPGWERIDDNVWPTLRNGEVMSVTCGIGMISAAAATEYVISTYAPEIVLNYGCAGAHHRDLFPGDVVIGERLVHQGRMRFAPNGDVIPLEFGFQVPGEAEQVTNLETDESLRLTAQEVVARMEFSPWPEEHRLVGQTDRAPKVMTGTLSSGDIWLQNPEMIDDVHVRTGSLCEDMEAAAIGQICAIHRVPFLSVKDISNSEFHEATVFEGSSSALHSSELGMRAAMVIVGVIEKIRQVT